MGSTHPNLFYPFQFERVENTVKKEEDSKANTHAHQHKVEELKIYI